VATAVATAEDMDHTPLDTAVATEEADTPASDTEAWVDTAVATAVAMVEATVDTEDMEATVATEVAAVATEETGGTIKHHTR